MDLTLAKLLDDKGWRILTELQQDGRLPFAELGRRVGLSTPAVAERVHTLEAAGVLRGYRADVDLAKLGLPILAFIRVNVVGDVLTRIVALAQEMPEVLECHRGTGTDSFTLKVAVASVTHLERVIDRLTPHGTTATSIVLSSPVNGRVIDRQTAVAAHQGAPATRKRPPRL
jgi:Lrp/AsnC family leucine-responsive transcriptional regulator